MHVGLQPFCSYSQLSHPAFLGCRYDLTSFQSGQVVSSSLFGALGGSALAFVVGDKLGRKKELLLAALLYGMLAEIEGCHKPHGRVYHHRLDTCILG